MYRIFSVFLVLAVLLVNIALAATQQEEIAQEVKIVSAEFGLFNAPQSGKPAFVPTLAVPFEINQAYGWVIQISTTKQKVRWREEFTLPAPPKTWAEVKQSDGQTFSGNGKTCVLEGETKAGTSVIHNAWTVVPGDPKGRYVIRVTIEGSVERVFEFDIK
jgi:hypothetical protein